MNFDLRKLVPLGTAGPSCRLRQNFHQPSADRIPADAVVVAGNLLGEPVHWSEWSDAEGTFTQVSVTTRYASVEVSCHASNKVDIAAMRKIIETFRRTEWPEHR